ncbi:MAG TPA: thermostable hemolysin [Caulobacteraceae bacterium]|nr:thermostable hemolysin [Caulobacteraceae bacterium]
MTFQTLCPEGGHAPGPVTTLAARLFRTAPSSAVFIHSPSGSDHRDVEAFVDGVYVRAFGCVIRNHYPNLISLRDARGSIQAAAGFRSAGHGPLFLEQYLDQPIEAALLAHFEPVPRDRIVEVGNLAGRGPAASLRLFLALARRLQLEGATHVVATATRQLRRTFRRLGLESASLTRAEPARLAGGGNDWGGYYTRDPVVMAGAITPSLPRLVAVVEEAGL